MRKPATSPVPIPQAAEGRAQRVVGGLGRLLFAAWLAAVFLIITGLGAAHWYALPRADAANPKLVSALSKLRAGAGRPGWSLNHVLYGQCACSRRLIEHLRTRGALPDVSEQVILAGAQTGQEASLRARGFGVDVIKPSELKTRYGLEAAPLLIVAQPSGAVRYLGGYTDRKQGPVIRDREILSELMRGEDMAALPLFGCAVSRSLQRALDPLGLKYEREKD